MRPEDKQQVRQRRDPAAIQAEIERAREEITSSVLALRERMSAAADWRVWVRRRPEVAVGVALAFGVWLGWQRRPVEPSWSELLQDYWRKGRRGARWTRG